MNLLSLNIIIKMYCREMITALILIIIQICFIEAIILKAFQTSLDCIIHYQLL